MPSSSGSTPQPLPRFLAFLIDGVIAGLLSTLFFAGGVLGAAYLVVRDGLSFQFMNQRSVGKHLMGLHVTRLDGRPMDIEASVQRNWMWGLGPVGAVVAHVPLFGAFSARRWASSGWAWGCTRPTACSPATTASYGGTSWLRRR